MVKKEFGLEEGLIKTGQIKPYGLCLSFICVLLFTSRLRHGHTEGKVVVVVVLGTFWSSNQKTIVVNDYTW